MKKRLTDFVRETMDISHINRADLCRGLCSVSALSKYLNQERKMDRLLLTAVLQRLGLSAVFFITLLSEEEYSYFEWRQDIAVAQLSGDWTRVQELLEDKAENPVCNAALQRQFYLMMQGHVRKRLSRDFAESAALYEQAIRITNPDFPCQMSDSILLNVQEIMLLLFWQAVQPDKRYSEELLKFLEQYVPAHFRDEQVTIKIYPKIVSAYLPFLLEQGKYTECFSMAEKTIDMMVSSAYASCMRTVLHFYIQAAEKLGREQGLPEKRAQLAAWKELMDAFGQSGDDNAENELLPDVWQEIELLDEMLCRNRLYRGYSQEKLSEGICSPETLSRIENARQSPTSRTFTALARKLSMQEEFYYHEIQPDNMDSLGIYWRIMLLSMNRQYEEVGKAVKLLEKKLDMSIPCNRQYVADIKNSVKCETEEVPAARQLADIREILGITLENLPEEEEPRDWPETFWSYPFRTEEISLLMQMSDIYYWSGRREEAELMYEKLLQHYQESRVRLEFHYRTAMLIVVHLSQCTGVMKNYVKELKYSEEGIRLHMISGARKLLPTCVNNLADALENMGQKEKALKFYRLAFYSAELMKREGTAKVARRSYEKLLGREIQWY